MSRVTLLSSGGGAVGGGWGEGNFLDFEKNLLKKPSLVEGCEGGGFEFEFIFEKGGGFESKGGESMTSNVVKGRGDNATAGGGEGSGSVDRT